LRLWSTTVTWQPQPIFSGNCSKQMDTIQLFCIETLASTPIC
jgi:hypothetical protein